MEKIFADGIQFKRPKQGAPEFVKGKISVNVETFTNFMNQHQQGGWVNIDLLKSAKGNLYLVLNTWKNGERKSDDEFPPLIQ
jgi:hypothetical protein